MRLMHHLSLAQAVCFMADFDPQALLTKPLDEVKAPAGMPLGSYVFVPISREFGKAQNEKETPKVTFTVRPVEALPDVVADDLTAAEAQDGKKLSEREQKLDFFLTPDSLFRLKEFGVDHCKVPEGDVANTGELIEAIVDGTRQFVGVMEQQPNKKNPERPYVNLSKTAAVPE